MNYAKWSLIATWATAAPSVGQWAWWHIKHRQWPSAGSMAWLIAIAWLCGSVFWLLGD